MQIKHSLKFLMCAVTVNYIKQPAEPVNWSWGQGIGRILDAPVEFKVRIQNEKTIIKLQFE